MPGTGKKGPPLAPLAPAPTRSASARSADPDDVGDAGAASSRDHSADPDAFSKIRDDGGPNHPGLGPGHRLTHIDGD